MYGHWGMFDKLIDSSAPIRCVVCCMYCSQALDFFHSCARLDIGGGGGGNKLD